MSSHAALDRDPEYLRFRRHSVDVAVLVTFAMCPMILGYLAASWERPHRAAIAALTGLAIAIAVAIRALHAERLVETRWCDPFFGVWSSSYVAIAVVFALLDGGALSPLAFTFFPILVFAGLCYPLRLAGFVGVTCVAGYIALGVLGSSSPDAVLYISGCLLMTAVMCAWQAHTLDRQRRELALASRTDPLTGCLNRRGFDERLAGELARAAREGEELTLILFDLDGFKQVNDAHGHAAGDRLLCWVVAQATELLRPVDAVGRLGGDEFALLVPGAGAEAGREVAVRLLATLRQDAPASVGVASFPAHGADAEALLHFADGELYRHKRRPELYDAVRPVAAR
jgi:diguanylate cyclase (GGDEF)-like protein